MRKGVSVSDLCPFLSVSWTIWRGNFATSSMIAAPPHVSPPGLCVAVLEVTRRSRPQVHGMHVPFIAAESRGIAFHVLKISLCTEHLCKDVANYLAFDHRRHCITYIAGHSFQSALV